MKKQYILQNERLVAENDLFYMKSLDLLANAYEESDRIWELNRSKTIFIDDKFEIDFN